MCKKDTSPPPPPPKCSPECLCRMVLLLYPFPQASIPSLHSHSHFQLSNLTSSPTLKAGNPTYGHPSHRKASPNAQFPQLPTFPCTVKSTSAKSSAASFASFSSAAERLAASSAARVAASPHVQSLQARRRFPGRGRHSGAASGERELVRSREGGEKGK